MVGGGGMGAGAPKDKHPVRRYMCPGVVTYSTIAVFKNGHQNTPVGQWYCDEQLAMNFGPGGAAWGAHPEPFPHPVKPLPAQVWAPEPPGHAGSLTPVSEG